MNDDTFFHPLSLKKWYSAVRHWNKCFSKKTSHVCFSFCFIIDSFSCFFRGTKFYLLCYLFSLSLCFSVMANLPARLRICWLYPLQRKTSPFKKKRVSWVWQLTASDGEVLFLEYMGNVEYPFIAITSRSTLTKIESNCSGPIYGSNISIWKLLCRML